ncbi:Uncharacterized protein Rs2_08976 [Raphanus sativus]|uniref:Uncharacterized protein LOC108840255 n=1 Tax=Raphanus sativus TaxID=3726 RepID=A0A6J0M953_RAPSA|nr:uncharacterized protein LOC108840255 [Raphanus sativus]KAJ4914355.1 Uncharacterized protein Rs2_08976 [Raphanus sativus]
METSQNTNLQNPKPTTPFHYRLEEELSLRDLPLNAEKNNSTAATTTTEDQRKRSIELFEFLTSTSDDCSPAENIIFRGKIIPLNYQNAILSSPEYIRPRISTRSESLSAIQGNKINRPVARDNARPMRISRSLDHRNLTRGPTTSTARGNASPTKIAAKPETVSSGNRKSVKPRWYVIMFGMVKFTPETELRNIKNRQVRRNVMFPSPADRRSCRTRAPSPSPSWRFLNALSCKEPTSVAATTPLWFPHT